MQILVIASAILAPLSLVSRNYIIIYSIVISTMLLRNYINQLRSIDTSIDIKAPRGSLGKLSGGGKIFLLITILLAFSATVSYHYDHTNHAADHLNKATNIFAMVLIGFMGLKSVHTQHAVSGFIVAFLTATLCLIMAIAAIVMFGNHNVLWLAKEWDICIHPIAILLLWPTITYYVIKGKYWHGFIIWLIMIMTSTMNENSFYTATTSVIFTSIIFALAFLIGRTFRKIAMLIMYIPMIVIPMLFSTNNVTPNKESLSILRLLSVNMHHYQEYANMWQNAMRQYQKHQITGWGFDASSHIAYQSDMDKETTSKDELSVDYPRNLAIQILLESGIIGYAIICIAMSISILEIYQSYYKIAGNNVNLHLLRQQRIICAGKITTTLGYLFYLLHSTNIWQIWIFALGFMLSIFFSLIQKDIDLSMQHTS